MRLVGYMGDRWFCALVLSVIWGYWAFAHPPPHVLLCPLREKETGCLILRTASKLGLDLVPLTGLSISALGWAREELIVAIAQGSLRQCDMAGSSHSWLLATRKSFLVSHLPVTHGR